jgi:hypothetical protein
MPPTHLILAQEHLGKAPHCQAAADEHLARVQLPLTPEEGARVGAVDVSGVRQVQLKHSLAHPHAFKRAPVTHAPRCEAPGGWQARHGWLGTQSSQ